MAVIRRITKKLSKISFISLSLIIIFMIFYTINIGYILNYDKTSNPTSIAQPKKTTSKFTSNKMKYMLLWTSPDTTPFVYFGLRNNVFIKKKCKWNNCYVTNDRKYLGDYSEFEVIVFHGPELLPLLTFSDIPIRRNWYQKYVFANIEAASNYPICTNVWNGFFNWTWTYKLDSDAIWGYLAIRNASNHVIGPSVNMNWLQLDKMEDIDDELKNKLKLKSKPAAWFVSNCLTESSREKYVEELSRHLKKFNMDVNVYGKCGQYGCPKEIMSQCHKILEKTYYFYLAFENAISEDYVTERIVYALQHNTVPIVFGGANYTRFMPDGIYLNAYNMKAEILAAKMYQIIKNPPMYYKFFRWKKYYSYHLRNESPDTDDYCKFCALMNDEKMMKTPSTYEELNKWWTGPKMEDICHPTSYSNSIPIDPRPPEIVHYNIHQ